MIYKYFARIGRVLTLLNDSILYLSHPDQFNDPYDRLLCFDKRLDENGDPYTLPQIQYCGVGNSVGITCFSARNDSMLMWSHYANSHKGVCIGFEIPQAEQAMKRNEPEYFDLGLKASVCFQPVSYDKSMYTLHYDGGFFIGGDDAIRTVTEKIMDYDYEREIRLISLNESRQPVAVPRTWIRELIFGTFTTKGTKGRLRNLAATNNIVVKQMYLGGGRLGRMECRNERN